MMKCMMCLCAYSQGWVPDRGGDGGVCVCVCGGGGGGEAEIVYSESSS